MKYLVGLMMFGVCAAQAAPVVNSNAPGAVKSTVYRDSVDPDLYYLAPTSMQIEHDSNGAPLFSYIERGGFFSNHAIVQAVLAPKYDDAELVAVQKRILGVNPRARFTAVPFVESKMVLGTTLDSFIVASDCGHEAGVVGQQQVCSFELNDQGRRVLRDSFKKMITISLNLQYSVDGVIADGKGNYSKEVARFSIAAYFGGEELSRYPQLFRDARGGIVGMNDSE